MKKHLISVIIPVYNKKETLKVTIDSVIKQTYANIEIIVVDDGSNEDIESIIKSISDSRIIFLQQEHRNANVARNYGIRESKGKYIAMLDSDDIWLETHLSDCLQCLDYHNADGLYGSLLIRDNTNESIVHARKPYENETMIDYLLSTGFGAQTSTLFLTVKSIKNIQWDEQLNRHQDYDFVVRYSKKYNLIPKKEPTVIYCINHQLPMIDFNSCIQFIKNNETDIRPDIYNKYHRGMLSLARRVKSDELIISHYKKEATFYKEFLSFNEYIQLKYPSNQIQYMKYKFQYLLYIFRLNIDL